jgi:hypothetical protein
MHAKDGPAGRILQELWPRMWIDVEQIVAADRARKGRSIPRMLVEGRLKIVPFYGAKTARAHPPLVPLFTVRMGAWTRQAGKIACPASQSHTQPGRSREGDAKRGSS